MLNWLRAISSRAERVRVGTRSRARQTDVQHLDAEILHEVEEVDLVFDGRIGNGRRLETVAQGFIVQQNRFFGQRFGLADLIPVINQLLPVRMDASYLFFATAYGLSST